MNNLTLYLLESSHFPYNCFVIYASPLDSGLLKVATMACCTVCALRVPPVHINMVLGMCMGWFTFKYHSLPQIRLFLFHNCLLPPLFYLLVLFPPPPKELHWWKVKNNKNLHALCLQIISWKQFTSLIYFFSLFTSVVYFNRNSLSGLELQLWFTTMLLCTGPQHGAAGTRDFHGKGENKLQVNF